MKPCAPSFLIPLFRIPGTVRGKKMKNQLFQMPEHYKLSFSDEFDTQLDTSVWRVSDFTPRKGGYWSPEQVTVRDGKLIIQTQYIEQSGKSGYYTGELRWDTIKSTYGYYEIRCKAEDVRGAWSAFWLMPDTVSNLEQKAQDGCEIDIFETALRNKIQNTLHYDNYKSHKKRISKVSGLYDVFHTFALDWKKGSMHFYYDNQLLWKVTDPNLISQYPVSMEISTEINGSIKDGAAKPSRWFWLGCGRIDNADNILPSQFIIDYVRVYDNGDLIWSK